MRMLKGWPISVCSWSFQEDIKDVAASLQALDVGHVNLALLPALLPDGQAYKAFIKGQDWEISSTMISFPCEDYSTLERIKVTGGLTPDDHWDENRTLALGAIDLTAELEAEYLLMHFGFIDHSDAAYVQKFYDRTKLLADAAAEKGVKFLLETGQETAEELKHFIEGMDHPALWVNFDPANMILYDKGVPVEAIRVLAPWVRHVHIKDATRTEVPGTWGAEVPWGTGEVDGDAFLRTLEEIGFQGALAIEREAGDDRFGDIKMAAEKLSA
ncbi:MAG: sugar phosphate isomerase/epimerase [Planctomycetes bacterium]|nr:sugar phosphate isomerase/epimerase [Planctomycetota bacterium]